MQEERGFSYIKCRPYPGLWPRALLWEVGGKALTPSERLFGAGHSARVIVFRLRTKPRSLALFS